MSVKRYYSYREFCDYARRFNQVDLLSAIARTAVALPDSASDPRYRRTLPCALAGLAKASICHGNRYRSTTVRLDTIARACHMYNNLAPEELEDEEPSRRPRSTPPMLTVPRGARLSTSSESGSPDTAAALRRRPRDAAE
jgi:hypothetical protein